MVGVWSWCRKVPRASTKIIIIIYRNNSIIEKNNYIYQVLRRRRRRKSGRVQYDEYNVGGNS